MSFARDGTTVHDGGGVNTDFSVILLVYKNELPVPNVSRSALTSREPYSLILWTSTGTHAQAMSHAPPRTGDSWHLIVDCAT